MKKLSMLIIFITMIASSATAKILRVGYSATSVPIPGVDYTTLQPAHDAASVGDTIQIYPANPIVTYTCTLTKRLTLIGTGYFTDGGYNANTNLQVIGGDCVVNLTFNTGSSGSVVQGIGTARMTGNDVTSAGGLSIAVTGSATVNNILIKRCHFYSASVQVGNSSSPDSWTFTGCYFYGTSITTAGATTVITNLRVENCIFYAGGTNINLLSGSTSGHTGQIINNTFYANYDYFNNGVFLFQNNIYPDGNNLNNVTNCTFQNNITSSAQSGNSMNTSGSSGNVYGVSFYNNGGSTTTYNTVFVGYPYNVDGTGNTIYTEDTKWQLKPGSAASGVSTTGGDCGVYGGVAPYKLSGIPNTPAFYKLTSSSVNATTSPYTITFSVRSNN